MRGRKNQEKPSSANILPPCKVCGEPGTGFHYGVTTCGACKGFFRRSITRDEPYECIQSPLCHVGPSTSRRKSCPKCRYDKCVVVGMCKEACKVGRYSRAKKTNDIKEALEGQLTPSSLPPSSPSADNTMDWQHNGSQTLPQIPQSSNTSFKSFMSASHNNNDVVIYPGLSTVNDATVCFSNSMDAVKQNNSDSSSGTPTFTILNNSISSTGSHPITAVLNNAAPISPTCFVNNNFSADDSIDKTTFPSWGNCFQTQNNFNPPNSIFTLTNQASNHDIPNLSQYITPTHNVGHSSSISNLMNRVSPIPLSSPVLSTKDGYTPSDGATPDYSLNKPGQLPNSMESMGTSPYQTNPKYQVHMNSAKRFLEEGDEESQRVTKRQSILQTMEADSSKNLSPENSTSFAPVSKGNDDNKGKPITLLFVAPDPMKYVLSIFDKFHYYAAEKDAIAPLLKLCYDSNNWIDDFLPQNVTQRTHIEAVTGPPCFKMHSILPTSHSPERPTCAEDIQYDDEGMENLADFLLAAYTHYYGPESSFLSGKNKENCLDMFHMICQVHDSLKGKLNLVDDDTYFTILETTGLDVDRRKEYFNSVIRDFDVSFTRDSKYYRALPGFKDLSLKDRINLTKSTFVIARLFPIFRCIDKTRDIYIDEERGMAIRRTVYAKITGLSKCLCLLFVNTYNQYHSLDLTFQELVILKAALIMYPDYCDGLEEPHRVTSMNEMYLKCLHHRMKTSHAPELADDRFNKVLKVLEAMTSLRDVFTNTRLSLRRVVEKLLDGKKHALIKEVLCD